MQLPPEDYGQVLPFPPGGGAGELPPDQTQPEYIEEWIPAGPPATAPEDLVTAAKEWVPKFIQDGLDFIDRKIRTWKLLEHLFWNRIRLSDWNKSIEELDDFVARCRRGLEEDPEAYETDQIISTYQLVMFIVVNMFRSIFSSDPWFSVNAEEILQEPSIEDPVFSTAKKLEPALSKRLHQSQIKSQTAKGLLHGVLYGEGYAKTIWNEKTVPYYSVLVRKDPQGNIIEFVKDEFGKEQLRREEKLVSALPVLDVLKPDTVIPDSTATNADIQSWQGIAHVTEMSWNEIMSRFKGETFNLNEDEFVKQYPEPESAVSTESNIGQIAIDRDREGSDEQSTYTFKVWEYHGQIPTKKGSIESVCTFITEKSAENCDSGILVRCIEGPALTCGKRPFVHWQYTPWAEPHTIGAIEPHFDKIWMLSHLKNLLSDGVKFTITPWFLYRPGSDFEKHVEEHKGKFRLKPGEGYPGDKNDLKWADPPNLDVGAMGQVISSGEYDFQMASGVQDVGRGISGAEKTASEVHHISEMANAPLFMRLQIFAETFLDPGLYLLLNLFQQFEIGNSVIQVPDSTGVPQPQVLTAEELRTGKYSITSNITQETTARLAYAQTLKDLIPQIPQLIELCANEGQRLMLTPILRDLFTALKIQRIDRIIQPMTEGEQLDMFMNQLQQALADPQGFQFVFEQLQQAAQMFQGQQGGGPAPPPESGQGQGGGAGMSMPPIPPEGPPSNVYPGPMEEPLPEGEIIRRMLQQQAADMEGRTNQI